MSRREEILARLEAVLSMSGTKFKRNRVDFSDAELPGVALLDGDESALEATYNRGRPPSGPNLLTMTVGVHIAAMKREGVGTDLNTLRDRILEAVLTDSVLINLVHNRDIRYEGCQTAFQVGRTMAGEMDLFISLTYVHRI